MEAFNSLLTEKKTVTIDNKAKNWIETSIKTAGVKSNSKWV
jgi:hypothetical protein